MFSCAFPQPLIDHTEKGISTAAIVNIQILNEEYILTTTMQTRSGTMC